MESAIQRRQQRYGGLGIGKGVKEVKERYLGLERMRITMNKSKTEIKVQRGCRSSSYTKYST
jgi:hypothetical protein